MTNINGNQQDTPASMLEGVKLESGWKVGPLIKKTDGQTGGHFSCAYGVQKGDGQSAFLKAMDYTSALRSSSPATELNRLTATFLFERQILKECADRKLSKIVKAIDEGLVIIQNQPVEYLIFEEAKGGDIRRFLTSAAQFNLIWTLTCIHNICVGIQQLHGAGIAHQDLKPSNVLHFPDAGEKLADLGRAWHRTKRSPHDSVEFAGDWGYAPPEFHYGFTAPDESDRRFGSDFYLVGSMILFLFSGLRASEMLIGQLDLAHQPKNWTGKYEEVLPYLAHAFSANLAEIGTWFEDVTLRSEIIDVLRQMCDPNLATRGDNSHFSKHGSRFALQRFISRFDRLRTYAILGRIHHQ